MAFDFLVLGATGEEGGIASRDLLKSGYSVLLCGRNESRVKALLKYKKAKFEYVDLNNISHTASVIRNSGASIVLNCAELKLNLNAMKACLEVGANYLDLGGLQHMTVKQYRLDSAFRRKKLIALLGCGSTPGISNIMVAYAAKKLDSIDRVELGFAWDSNYKTFVLPYSFESIVEEVTSEPVILREGKLAKVKACEFMGSVVFKGIGMQNTYCMVHSEVYTFYKYFKRMGLKEVRYRAGFPGHAFNVLNTLISLGFGSDKPMDVRNTKVVPVEFTREVLKEYSAKRRPGYEETEYIWARVYGKRNGAADRVSMKCDVRTLKGWEYAGSNIDTGMSISIIAQMLKQKLICGTGVTAPEASVPPEIFFRELKERGMVVSMDNRPVIKY